MSRFRPIVTNYPHSAVICTQRGRKPLISQQARDIVDVEISRRDSEGNSCTAFEIRSLLVEEQCRIINSGLKLIHFTPSNFKVSRRTLGRSVDAIAPTSVVVAAQTARRLRARNELFNAASFYAAVKTLSSVDGPLRPDLIFNVDVTSLFCGADVGDIIRTNSKSKKLDIRVYQLQTQTQTLKREIDVFNFVY